MGQHIVWEEAHVGYGTLTVPLAGPGPEDPNMWNAIFEELAGGRIAGVDYAGNLEWGKILGSPHDIVVEDVSAPLVDDLRRHLDAVLHATNAEYDRRRRKETERAEEDARLTDLFRGSTA